jgi:Carboxypeptidase regulatory-like domain
MLSFLRFVRYGSLVCLLLLAASAVWADVSGSISGSVKDPSGAAIANASVVAVNLETGVQRTAQTDANGAYSVLALQVGRYRLIVTQAGFEKYEVKDIVVDANSSLRFDISLAVGSVNETVEVGSSGVQVETINTYLGDVIKSQSMEELPLNGRSYTDLLGLQPGVAPASAATVHNGFSGDVVGAISVSGSRETANSYVVNGGSAGDPLTNGASVIPNLDSIAEFRLLTNNFDAEYGHFSGGIINVVTKSGANSIHGDGFEFLRNQNFDARNFFDNARGAFQQNQFGGTLGGPVRHDKVFFFADYQGTRETRGLTSTATLPSAAEHSGQFDPSDLTGTVRGAYWASVLSQRLGYAVTNSEPYSSVFPGGLIPSSAFSSPAQKIAPLIAVPTQGSLFSGLNNTTTRDDRGGLRMDADTRFGQLSAYYFVDDEGDSSAYGLNPIPGFGDADANRAQQFVLGATKVFSSTALNELRLNYNRLASRAGTPTGSGTGSLSSFGFVEGGNGIVVTAPSQEGVPSISFNDFSIGEPGTTFNRFENTFQVLDNFSLVRGSHTFKFGGETRYVQFNQRLYFGLTYAFSGAETGDDFADFLIGAPDFYFQLTPDQGDGRTHYGGLFAQDSWRVTSSLTLNYGVRWDVSQPWYDTQNRVTSYLSGEQSKIYPTAPLGFVFPGDPGVSRGLSPTRWNDFGPRIGIAYSPSATSGFLKQITGGPGQSSVRASYGLFYTAVEDLQQFYSFGEPPFLQFYFSPSPPVFETPFINRVDGVSNGQRFPLIPIQKGDPNGNFAQFLPISSDPAFATNNVTPYSEHYSLSFQRQLGGKDLLTLSYVGTQGHHLLVNVQPHPGIPSTCLFLSNPANLAPGGQPCGPGLEDISYVTASGTTVDGTRGPQFPSTIGGTALITTQGNSAYNALEVSLRHQSGPLSFLASYTYSKSIDSASSSVGNLLYPFNLGLDRALSQFDATHNFVVSYNYRLPFDKLSHDRWHRLTADWNLSGITRFSTGFPITMQDSGDQALLGGAGFGQEDRPDYNNGPLNLGQNPRSDLPYFNTGAFSSEQLGQFGTSSYRFFHGPGIANFDMALLKDVAVTERLKLQLRGEFFNIFNHAQFLNPSGNINSGSFGMVTSARDPRIGQLAVKLLF